MPLTDEEKAMEILEGLGLELEAAEAPPAKAKEVDIGKAVTQDGYIKPAWYPMLVHHLERGNPVYLQGPPGNGKTTAIKVLAEEAKRPCFIIQGHTGLAPEELKGHMSLTEGKNGVVTEFTYATLAKSLKEPGAVLLLDQLDALPESVQFMFLGLLDTNREFSIPETGETIQVQKDWRFVATGNPGCLGTRPMIEPLVSRMVCIECPPHDAAMETKILASKYPKLGKTRAAQVVKAASAVREGFPVNHQFQMDLRTEMQMVGDYTRTANMHESFNAIVLPKLGEVEPQVKEELSRAVGVILSDQR